TFCQLLLSYIVTLSLHDALPICKDGLVSINGTGSICYGVKDDKVQRSGGWGHLIAADPGSGYYIGYNGLNAVFRAYDGLGKETRSEEHTSELQSRFDLVCRLLLE